MQGALAAGQVALGPALKGMSAVGKAAVNFAGGAISNYGSQVTNNITGGELSWGAFGHVNVGQSLMAGGMSVAAGAIGTRVGNGVNGLSNRVSGVVVGRMTQAAWGNGAPVVNAISRAAGLAVNESLALGAAGMSGAITGGVVQMGINSVQMIGNAISGNPCPVGLMDGVGDASRTGFRGGVVGYGSNRAGQLAGTGAASTRQALGAAWQGLKQSWGDSQRLGVAAGGGGRPSTKIITTEDGYKIGEHGRLKREKDGAQSHHLNQDAAFGSLIPREKGVAIKLVGDAFSDIGTEHFEAHRALEKFWDDYRPGGKSVGALPTVGEYNAALRDSLRAADLPATTVKEAIRTTVNQQHAYGLNADDFVPDIPGRINQAKGKQ